MSGRRKQDFEGLARLPFDEDAGGAGSAAASGGDEHVVGIFIALVALLNIAGCLWLIWWTDARLAAAVAAGDHPCLGRGSDGVQQSRCRAGGCGCSSSRSSSRSAIWCCFPGSAASRDCVIGARSAQWQAEEQCRATGASSSDLPPSGHEPRRSVAGSVRDGHGSEPVRAQLLHLPWIRCAWREGISEPDRHDWLWGGAPETIYQTIARAAKA